MSNFKNPFSLIGRRITRDEITDEFIAEVLDHILDILDSGYSTFLDHDDVYGAAYDIQECLEKGYTDIEIDE